MHLLYFRMEASRQWTEKYQGYEELAQRSSVNGKWKHPDNEININLPGCFNLIPVFHCNVFHKLPAPEHKFCKSMEMGANKRSERRNVRRPCSASENGPINKFCVWRILLSKSGPDERLKCFVARARKSAPNLSLLLTFELPYKLGFSKPETTMKEFNWKLNKSFRDISFATGWSRQNTSAASL